MHGNGFPPALAQWLDEAVAHGDASSAAALLTEALQVCRAQGAPQGARTPRAVPAVDGMGVSPDDALQALAHALGTGAYAQARQLALDGAARYPAHAALHKCAYVLAPPTVHAVPASAASRRAVAANHAWMQAHWQTYRGQWVALRAGRLLAARASYDALVAYLGATHGVFVTSIPA